MIELEENPGMKVSEAFIEAHILERLLDNIGDTIDDGENKLAKIKKTFALGWMD